MDKLQMMVSLVDQVTKPLQGISKQMQSTMDAGRQGMANMAVGGAGLVATGLAIQNALMPAIEMDRKLGEVASLRVTGDALKELEKTALSFSIKYGKSATGFIDATYDIKSAMGDLNADQLTNLTRITGVTAAATKANTKEMADYFGTMHSIFESSVNKMGKIAWAEQLSGYTSLAVDKFKTEGPKLAQAFKTLGNMATKEGASLAEQFAILGTLGQEMDGSVSATKYQAFITKAASAGEKLGLNFLDSNNNLLDTASILNEIKSKYGDLDSLEKVELEKAFGGKQAMSFITTLYDKTDTLKETIQNFSELKGMENSEWMASKMTDQWERLEAVLFAIRASVFGKVLPGINSIISSMVAGGEVLIHWIDEFPILGQILGVVAMGGIALGGVVAGLSLAMGIAQLTSKGWELTTKGLSQALKFLRIQQILSTTSTWLLNTAIGAGKLMSAGWALTTGTLGTAFKVLRATTLLMTTSVWAFSAALLANPITWIVLGIGALAAGLAIAIMGWDDFKAAFKDTAVFKMLSDTIDWVIDKLNMIPGIDIDVSGNVTETPELKTAIATSPMVANNNIGSGWAGSYNREADNARLFSYKQPQNKTALPAGMVANATSYNQQTTGNTKNYGGVTINTTAPATPDMVAEWEELNAG